MNIKQIIGDYKIFFTYIVTQLETLHINVQGMPISHMCYRVSTLLEYETTRDQLKSFCSEYVETQFRERPVSLLFLKKPLEVSGNRKIPLIELPALRQTHVYNTGLEHIGIVVGKKLVEFKEQYKNLLTGEKDRTYFTIPFIEFPNGTVVKFYERPLKEIVELEGWKFEPTNSN